MPPYFLYHLMPERWADWCCERPENLAYLLSGLAIVMAIVVFVRG